MCNEHFSTTYYSTLPTAAFNATAVYARISLPPQTRFMESDAHGGELGKILCSVGTVGSIRDFMTSHLTQLGWQQVGRSTLGCIWAGDVYRNPQCWKNGVFTLFLGINSNSDWIILFQNPDYTS